ncbi:MAG TPA: hypothetical protein VGO96_02115 [Pyrinomonadaceae bacterium]|jgi:hypothetical protein|nr:hypothetical protein [Pyrinomonadaceae bacterium]
MRRKIINLKLAALTLLLTAAWLLAFPAHAAGQERGGLSRRVRFPARRACTILRGSVQPPRRDTYIFHARKGQLIVTDVFYHGNVIKRRGDDEEGSSDFIFVHPNGERIEDAQDVVFSATQTGDYRVVVRPTRRRTNPRYTLKISLHPSDWTDTYDIFDAASRQRCP